MKKKLLFTLLIVFVVNVPLLWASQRAIMVSLRTADEKGAPVAEQVSLYQNSHALVIGIDQYTHGWPRLSGAVKDARLVANALKAKGFSVTLKTNVTGDQLITILDDFFIDKGIDPESRLFIWFAGHGHTLKGEGYLIPADCPVPSDKRGFRKKALSMRRFGELVRQADSKHAFAVFDSCFSGTIFSTQRSLPPAAVTRATTYPVRQFLSSGDADQSVSDNGQFRRLFIRALNGEENADANHDGYVTGSELGMFLSDRITNLTNAVQTPKYGKLRDDRYDRGDFVFVLNQPARPNYPQKRVMTRPVSTVPAQQSAGQPAPQRTQPTAQSPREQEQSTVEREIQNDVEHVGQAARREVRDQAAEGVRNLIKGFFK